jgi:hypothetical protein
MSPRRFLGEAILMLGVASGTLIGFAAGQTIAPQLDMVFAFVGMGLGGAFVDICLRGGQP